MVIVPLFSNYMHILINTDIWRSIIEIHFREKSFMGTEQEKRFLEPVTQ